MDEKTDNELMNAIIEGGDAKDRAFTEFYQRYANRVYSYCRKIIGDGRYADDIFQETFLKFLATVEKGTIIQNSLGYLLKTAKNLIYNYHRDNLLNFIELDEIHCSTNDTTYESIEFSNIVEHALTLLPEEHKEAFVLQTYEGLTFNEISELTDVPLTTVRNRIVRSKRKLREILKPYLEYSRCK